MLEPTCPRLIHFLAASKSFRGPGPFPNVVLRPTTISLPLDRRVAILGARHAGKTTLLNLMARKLQPDRGDVLGAVGLSPIVNGGGYLHPQLSAYENMRFLARAFGVDAERLIRAVDAFCGIDFPLDTPVKAQDAVNRKTLEAAIAMVLPFSCYMFDEIGQLQSQLLDRCVDAARQRDAGFVFATSQTRLVRRYAEWVVVIDDATLHNFSKAQDAIEFFERQGCDE